MFKRNFNNSMSCCQRPTIDVENSDFREPSPVDALMYPRRKKPDGSFFICFEDDLFLLFNQERIVGADALNKFIASLQPEKKQDIGLSDAQLVTFLKSRYLQSPSELRAWSDFLLGKAKELKQEYTDALEKYKAEQEEKDTPAPVAAPAAAPAPASIPNQ